MLTLLAPQICPRRSASLPFSMQASCLHDLPSMLRCSPTAHGHAAACTYFSRQEPSEETLHPAQHGCLVVNAPTANTVAAAEHGIALICALSRNVAQADASVKAGKWERTKYVGVSIVGKTLAIMGFGKVLLLHSPGCRKSRFIAGNCLHSQHIGISHAFHTSQS